GRGGRRLLFRQERRGGEGDGRQARVHSQSLQQKPRAQTRAEEALVPQWAKMADRMRGAHQRGQAATRSRSLPLQRLRRNEPLGWPRHYRRQRRQHRPRDRKAIKAVSSPSPLKLSNRPPVTPAGIALRLSIDRRSPKRNLAPGSSLARQAVAPVPAERGRLCRFSRPECRRGWSCQTAKASPAVWHALRGAAAVSHALRGARNHPRFEASFAWIFH